MPLLILASFLIEAKYSNAQNYLNLWLAIGDKYTVTSTSVIRKSSF